MRNLVENKKMFGRRVRKKGKRGDNGEGKNLRIEGEERAADVKSQLPGAWERQSRRGRVALTAQNEHKCARSSLLWVQVKGWSARSPRTVPVDTQWTVSAVTRLRLVHSPKSAFRQGIDGGG